MPGTLGRRAPEDFDHIEKYPLSLDLSQISSPRPVVLGINWYSAFDSPTYDATTRSYWVARDRNLGFVRGGHCVCLKPRGFSDPTLWWNWYDQGAEGACVGFGCSRMMSIYNGRRYYARWLWDHAKMRDEWSDTNPGDDKGTSVRAGFDVLRTQGHVHFNNAEWYEWDIQGDYQRRDALKPNPAEGISANRWFTNMDDLLDVLGYTNVGYVDILNSWGTYYPHLVRMPVDVLNRVVFIEDGEAGVATDR